MQSQLLDDGRRFERGHDAAAIVLRARAHVPGIDMAAHHHDFIGLLAPWDFAHHVGGIGVRKHVRLHIQMHGDGFAGIRQALDERGIFEGDGGGGNLGIRFGIIQRAGVGGLHGQRPDRSDQHGHRAQLGRARGARAAIDHRLAVSFIRHIEQHDLAGHLLAAQGVQRVEAGDGTTSAVMPSGGVATLPPRPSMVSGWRTGLTISASSRPRTQCGTLTAGVATFSKPSRFICAAAH
jgi:hypothetical protein